MMPDCSCKYLPKTQSDEKDSQVSAVARPNGQQRQAGVARGVRGHVCMYVCMYVCIPNWPLPIGAFQDQCKQIVINKHIKVKNPNWREADQLAIYKRRREVELGATKNNIS